MTGPIKILAVDDEADFEVLIRQRFRHQIRDQEFTFRFARHGEEAFSALEAEPDIDLMLLDINMPVMDGLTLLARLREQRSAVRAIIVSAYGDMVNLRTAMNRGAFDFVTKPVDRNDLEITIRKTLDDIAKLRDLDRRVSIDERARFNLARYFSPNIVAMLAERDEPFGEALTRAPRLYLHSLRSNLRREVLGQVKNSRHLLKPFYDAPAPSRPRRFHRATGTRHPRAPTRGARLRPCWSVSRQPLAQAE